MSALYGSITWPAAIQGLWEGTIATTPATVDEKVLVTLNPQNLPDGFSPDFQWGPCVWQPRLEPATVDVSESGEAAHLIDVPKLLLPKRGDGCLIGFDENDRAWVLSWWPYG